MSSEHIKNYVTGHGITFKSHRQNEEAFAKATAKWAQIYSQIGVAADSILMFAGAKNNGKSNLVRYLVNRYLAGADQQQDRDDDFEDIDSAADNYEQASFEPKYCYYVDLDPGQCEMTTPGIVSVHIIRSSDAPLSSPTYTNMLQYEPIAMSSVGGVNMGVNPRMFIDNCRFVINQLREHQNKQDSPRPVFINTMGFVRNVGLAMLMDVIKICRPTELVVLNVESDPLRVIYADLSAPTIEKTRASFYYESFEDSKGIDYKYHVYNLDFSFVDSSSVARQNRTALQLAYLSFIPETIYMPALHVPAKLLSLANVYLHCVSSYPLEIDILLELLYHSWIHLVKLKRLPTRNVQSSAITGGFNILDEVGQNYIYGCGIITGIDIENRQLAIVTPMSEENLRLNVNCVIKPLSIQVPREIIQV